MYVFRMIYKKAGKVGLT